MTSFVLNGESVTVDVPSDMPLLWILRDTLDSTGTKYGCGIAQCGACTVLFNGSAMRSCQVRASMLDGAEITTIEGLGGGDELHVVQEAWIRHQVAQCGYCQSGQIVQAASLLSTNPNPSDAEIDQTMSGNLCRCGTYPRIRAAVRDAAAMLAETTDV